MLQAPRLRKPWPRRPPAIRHVAARKREAVLSFAGLRAPVPEHDCCTAVVAQSLRTILYVDDEPDIRAIVQMALELSPGLKVEL